MDQETPSVPSSQGSSSFDMPPNLEPPEPMGGRPSPEASQNQAQDVNVKNSSSTPVPVVSPPPAYKLDMPKRPAGSYFLIIFLILLLIAGGLVFSAWRGWISLGGLSELLNGGSAPTSTPSAGKVSPKISPEISASPSATSSPAVTTNVNDETRKKDLANLKNALEKYFTEKAEYPKSAAKIKTSDPNNVLTQALVPNFLAQMPDDPLTPKYYYGYQSDGQSFELTGVLEDKSDTAGTLVGDFNVYKLTNTSSQ